MISVLDFSIISGELSVLWSYHKDFKKHSSPQRQQRINLHQAEPFSDILMNVTVCVKDNRCFFSKNKTEMILSSLLCRTWLQCRSGRDSDSCCPASSNVSSAVKGKMKNKVSWAYTLYRHYRNVRFYFTREIPSVLNSTHENRLGEEFCPAFRLTAVISDWALLGVWGYQSYQVVPACIMNHPALLHHCGAPPLGVFDGLDHPHQRDVAAGGRAKHMEKGKR